MRMVDICVKETPKIGIKEYTLEDIFLDVCVTMGQPVEIVRSKDRHREYATCRQIYCYVARTYTKFYLQKVADVAGYRDHSVVIANAKKVGVFLKYNDPVFKQLWEKYTQESAVWPHIS